MDWNIIFYPGVEESILNMPPKIQARMLKLLELIEKHGANIGPPHTPGVRIVVQILNRPKIQQWRANGGHYAEIFRRKKSQKTPKNDLALATGRMKEVKSE